MCATYNREPIISIKGDGHAACRGYVAIATQIAGGLRRHGKTVIAIECYPGVRTEEIVEGLCIPLQPAAIIHAERAAQSTDEIHHKIQRFLTDDRVFGYMAPFSVEDFYNQEKLEQLREEIDAVPSGVVVVIGTGASLVTRGDVLVYADLCRWEIQLRYRSQELGNWLAHNEQEEILKKYKRGFFVEWRAADRLKRTLLPAADFYLDTNADNDPKLVAVPALLNGLKQCVTQPFRLVPYFDPGVWGGTWLQEHIGLAPREHPYAWGFDGVPEENSLILKFGDVPVEIPAINAVFFEPVSLLGERVYARFGAEFPIRFDFLDTVKGGNLSLQVHPLTDYIKDKFGMSYTQDESYYILDADPGAQVYLGFKDGVDRDQLIDELEAAQSGSASFPAGKYVNVFPARKHDHFLIPAGTIHCIGAGAMVLEISATPYIFTFKLWDWDRLGLDGKPRPVHIEHGKRNLQWDRTTAWTESQLVNRTERIRETECWKEERTGLHELEFIETRRHWFTGPVPHQTNGNVHMLNLVEGEAAVVESPDGAFEPYVVHYAETFIIPAAVGAYTIRPLADNTAKPLATIKAYVRV
ncbi:mannose-6-phosphate isomerase [Paenibacillus nanensis]|uniref:Mannose-6-phosphate isomerase n=1 Tax=Paenibacillus nanensis TaxID=393251 RepID=A0A3A1VMC2_9BACL|nr:class I mannose-6-phosphate isomerase [Paenibacillus nanensis]RIX59663.1 mannose-6-phosphate isomerase [Paenibacillus nanensis]